MKTLTGKLVEAQRAYALTIPEVPGEAPELTRFGWAHNLAREVYRRVTGFSPTRDTGLWSDAERDEIVATIEALLDPHIDVAGHRLREAQHVVVREAAWLLDLEDLRPYYAGPPTGDEYVIRAWVEEHVRDLGIKHALLDMMIEHDRDLGDRDLVAQIHRQLDEDG